MTDFRTLCIKLADDLSRYHHSVIETDGYGCHVTEALLRLSDEALAVPQPPADGEVGDPWKDAVIDALVCAFLLNKENESDPKRALQDLMEWEAQLARDPLINAPAQLQAPSDGVMGAVNWQAIETAPRDGSFFIGANAEEVIVCNWPKQKNIDYAPGNWRKGRGGWNGAFVKTNSPLTHWMPVPELPLPSGEVK